MIALSESDPPAPWGGFPLRKQVGIDYTRELVEKMGAGQ
jgi:hypothetical protein